MKRLFEPERVPEFFFAFFSFYFDSLRGIAALNFTLESHKYLLKLERYNYLNINEILREI